MKKSFCILLCILVCLGLFPQISTARALVKNGDFESMTPAGYFTSWSTSLTANGLCAEGAYYGENCLRIAATTNFAVVGQNISGLSGGEVYMLRFAFKPESSAFYPFVTLTYYNIDGEGIGDDIHLSTASAWGAAPSKNTWRRYETLLELPQTCFSLSLRLRGREAGTVCCYDYVSLAKPIEEETGSSLLINGDFETMPSSDWISQTWHWTENFAYLTSGGYEDSACIRITSASNASYPYVSQTVTGLLGGGTYRVSALLKTENITNYVRYKCEFYKTRDGGRTPMGECISGDMCGLSGEWTQYKESFVMPRDADTVRLMLRIYGGTGTVYFDNVGLYLVQEPARADVRTDKTFYYSDATSGRAEISLNNTFSTTYTSMSAQLLCDGSVVSTISNRAISETFDFSISGMTVGEAHTLEVTLYDAAGNAYLLPEQKIYMFPRPENIGTDLLWHEEDGSVFHPVIGYHLPEREFAKASEAGINLVQAYGPVSTLSNLLDSALTYGMKVIVPLYSGDNFAGDASNLQSTLQTVRTIKNHPALFGYMIADEPFYCSRTSDIEERLINSYLAVKSEDTVHPVFLNESSVVPQFFDEAVRYTDVFCIDPYIGSSRDKASYVAEKTEQAVAAANGEKPVYILLQTFLYDNVFPTGSEIRNQVYQAFTNGALGIGYYCYENAKPGVNLCDTEIWGTLQVMAQDDLPFLFSAFVMGKDSLSKITDGVYAWNTDGGNYKIVIAGAEGGTHTETIGLENKVVCGGGIEETDFVFGGGQVTLSLAPFAAGYYSLYQSTSAVIFYKNGIRARTVSSGRYTAVGDFEKLYIAVYEKTEHGMELLSLHIGTGGKAEFMVEKGDVLKGMVFSAGLSPLKKAETLE